MSVLQDHNRVMNEEVSSKDELGKFILSLEQESKLKTLELLLGHASQLSDSCCYLCTLQFSALLTCKIEVKYKLSPLAARALRNLVVRGIHTGIQGQHRESILSITQDILFSLHPGWTIEDDDSRGSFALFLLATIQIDVEVSLGDILNVLKRTNDKVSNSSGSDPSVNDYNDSVSHLFVSLKLFDAIRLLLVGNQEEIPVESLDPSVEENKYSSKDNIEAIWATSLPSDVLLKMRQVDNTYDYLSAFFI